MSTPAAILKIKYKNGEEEEFKLENDRRYYIFGRGMECDYRFQSAKISNVHFTIIPGTKKHSLVDGFPGRRSGGEIVGKRPSTNGLRLNGIVVTSEELKKISPTSQGRADLEHGDKLLLPDGTEIEYQFIRPTTHLPRREDDTEAQYFPFTDVDFGGQK